MSPFDRIRRVAARVFRSDSDFVSVVLLLREPRTVSKQMLESAVRGAWKPHSNDTEQYFVVFSPPVVLIKAGEHMLSFLNAAKTYMESPQEVARAEKDLRVREAALSHKAWLSVDFVYPSSAKWLSADKRYAICAQLAAELWGDDCLAICFAGEERIVASTANSATWLRDFRTVDEFARLSAAPVVHLSDDLTDGARRKARERLPEFLQAFASRRSADVFLLKKGFSWGQHTEWMWVQVQTLEGDRFFGTLENDPLWIKGVKRGDGVQVETQEIEDWVYISKGKKAGGFSFPEKPQDVLD
jgi:uncharacterized protein YegJ (DUF2314 family)